MNLTNTAWHYKCEALKPYFLPTYAANLDRSGIQNDRSVDPVTKIRLPGAQLITGGSVSALTNSNLLQKVQYSLSNLQPEESEEQLLV